MNQTPPVTDPWQAGEASRAAGRLEQARSEYQAIVQAQPEHVPARLRLCELNEQLGDYRAAVAQALAASVPNIPHATLLLAVFTRLHRYGETRAAFDVVRKSLLLKADAPGVQAEIGTALALAGELELGTSLLDAALAAIGRDPPLVYSRARAHEFGGNYAEAARDYREVLAKAPDHAYARWSLAKMPQDYAEPGDLDAARRSAERVQPGSRDEAVLRLAAFHLLDRRDEVDAAWAQLERANAILRQATPYDGARTKALFEGIKRLSLPLPVIGGESRPVPVFILGMHRSGSTLLESLLGRHPFVTNGGELGDFPSQLMWEGNRHFTALDEGVLEAAPGFDYARLGVRYMRHVDWRAQGRGWLTDKLPMNLLNVGFIATALPQAKILHLVRDPMDTCFSNLKEVFNRVAGFSYDQADTADYCAGYLDLMAHWRQRFPGRVHDVRYANLVTQPEAEVEAARLACGLPTPVPATAESKGAVTTASSGQVRAGVHTRGLGAWKRYRRHLQPLAARLAQHGVDVDAG